MWLYCCCWWWCQRRRLLLLLLLLLFRLVDSVTHAITFFKLRVVVGLGPLAGVGIRVAWNFQELLLAPGLTDTSHLHTPHLIFLEAHFQIHSLVVFQTCIIALPSAGRREILIVVRIIFWCIGCFALKRHVAIDNDNNNNKAT